MHAVNVNGASIPAIGMGTWTLKGNQATALVQHALDAGYRHIDQDLAHRSRRWSIATLSADESEASWCR